MCSSDLSEAAVRARTNKLVEQGTIQIVGVTDPLRLGFRQMAMIGVRCERAALAERLELARFDAGQTIFHEGEPGRSLHVVISGQVEIFTRTTTGEHVTLDRTNGEFKQWIDLDGEKRLDLITGRCKRTTNAPF